MKKKASPIEGGRCAHGGDRVLGQRVQDISGNITRHTVHKNCTAYQK